MDKTAHIYYFAVMESESCKWFSKAAPLLEVLGEHWFLAWTTFQAAHTPGWWLVAPPHSSFLSLWPSCLSLQGPCDHMGPTRIVEARLPISGSLLLHSITSAKPPLLCEVTLSQVWGWDLDTFGEREHRSINHTLCVDPPYNLLVRVFLFIYCFP